MKKRNLAFKANFITIVFIAISTLGFAQSKTNFIGEWYYESLKENQPVPVAFFEPVDREGTDKEIFNLRLDQKKLSGLLLSEPSFINISVPYGNEVITLNLARVNISSENLFVNTDKGRIENSVSLHYRGIVNGNPAHIASFSLFDGDIMGFFSTDAGNFVIGKLEDASGDYCVYNDKILPPMRGFDCVPQEEETDGTKPAPQNKTTGIGCKTVSVYFECDYSLYQSKGSNTNNVVNYVLGFFNEVSALYANENIGIQISDIFVWTSLDPYASNTTASTTKNAFQAYRGTNFNGDLAHLLTTRSIGGGVASLNVLCYKSLAFGASQIYTYYSSAPTYSWTVEVVTHELGHNIGSWHTQNCAWVGGPLDNCYAAEGSCSPGPAPVGGGTIMSYCHLTGYGINFNNGFGQQPGDLIRSRILNTCFGGAGNGTAPTGLSTSDVTNASAKLNWVAVTGATQYIVEYRLASSSSWNFAGPTTNNYISVSGLTAGTNYEWHVRSDCSNNSPDLSFTTLSNQTTTCPPPTSLGTTSISQTVATFNWSSVTGAVSYVVMYNVSGSSNYTVMNPVYTNSMTIGNLSAGTSYDWVVKANCSVYSPAASFTTLSNSTTTPTTPTTGCNQPDNLTAMDVTTKTATLTWSAVPGAQKYQVKFHKLGAKNWTNYNNVNGTSLNVTGLNGGSVYEWMVNAQCGGSSSSGFTSVESFTTPSKMIMENESGQILLYPNPAKQTIAVDIEGWNPDEAGTASIYSVTGAKVKSFNLVAGHNEINLNDIEDGLYLLSVRNDGRETIFQKFIKQN